MPCRKKKLTPKFEYFGEAFGQKGKKNPRPYHFHSFLILIGKPTEV